MPNSVYITADPAHAEVSQYFMKYLVEAGLDVNSDNSDAYVYLGDLSAEAARTLNLRAFQEMQTLIAVGFHGDRLRLGPVVVYQESPCLACWREHQRLFPHNGYSEEKTASMSIDLPQPSLRQIAQALADYLHGRSGALQTGTIGYYDLPSGQLIRRARMVRSPVCPVCATLREHSAESYRSYMG